MLYDRVERYRSMTPDKFDEYLFNYLIYNVYFILAPTLLLFHQPSSKTLGTPPDNKRKIHEHSAFYP